MKKIGYIITVVVLLLIINGLVHSIWDLWNKQDLVKNAQLELESQRKENSSLKKQLSYDQSKSFIETQARDKLFMVKPGESNVVIASDLLPHPSNSVPQVQKSVWQQWFNLFFSQ